jgi:hypothetical protein
MLRCIPQIPSGVNMVVWFDTISSMLSNYEKLLLDIPISLELAIWKSKFLGKLSHNTAEKVQCRND